MVHLTIRDACGKNVSMNQSKKEKNRTPYDIETEVERFHWWFVTRRKLLRSTLASLKITKNCVSLEVGCGTGANLKELRAAGLYGIGLDRSFYALSLLRRNENFPTLAGDLNELPIRTESVGLVIAADVFEHLVDDAKGITESYRVLNKGGILIVTVPAFNFLWGIQDIVTGHKRRYSRRQINQKLKKVGFDLLKSSHFNFFLFFPILIARRVIQLLGLKIQSENEVNSPLLNSFLKAIFSLEVPLLKYTSFPFGVSILCIARK